VPLREASVEEKGTGQFLEAMFRDLDIRSREELGGEALATPGASPMRSKGLCSPRYRRRRKRHLQLIDEPQQNRRQATL
jgi:hypothetical protein